MSIPYHSPFSSSIVTINSYTIILLLYAALFPFVPQPFSVPPRCRPSPRVPPGSSPPAPSPPFQPPHVDAYCVLYSVSSPESFRYATGALRTLKREGLLTPHTASILVANKADLERHRQVPVDGRHHRYISNMVYS